MLVVARILPSPLGPADPFPEPGWRTLVDVGGGPLASPATRVALAADALQLHALFDCPAEPPLTVAVSRPHGPVYEDECVEIFWSDPCAAGRYLEVVVNPAGTVYAARVENPDGSRETWRVHPGAEVPGLLVAVSGVPMDAPPASWASWRCRISLPWEALGGDGKAPLPGEVRRGNLHRVARGRTTRFEALSPTLRAGPADYHVPDRFARIIFSNLL